MDAGIKNEQAIFVAAVGRVPPEQWEAYARDACAGDDRLLARVRQLLRAHAGADNFLEAPAPGLPATADAEPICEGPGTAVGPYKLLEQIGEGGFGVVFMAEQAEPLRRRVALKVLKPGMDTRQVVARFEAERQALALMDHPNIARVFDGGETASGRPYFVMELVRGVPITDFCDGDQLGVRERLALFGDVCRAVQHAHQKGIIHRDLKPSNVLVTLHDDKAVVKVIDFGVAKATGRQLTDRTLFTNFAQLIGTPLYMSPEQAQMSGLDIDTRTDIYSLGVLLYELLTGTTPFDKERLRTAGYDEMRRIIREEEPARPSTRICTLGQAAATVSANRQSDPRKLRRLMRGELDWVVMKTLEKDRNRRYQTANGLALDIQHYLADEPVQACPPSAGYRFHKFTQRNRAAIWTTGLVAAALVVGTVVSTWEAVRARRAEALADARLKAEREARQDADRNLQKARKATEDYFTVVCGIDILLRQGKDAEAEKAIREVLAARESLVADFPSVPDYRDILARTHYDLAVLLGRTQRLSEADEEYRRAIDVWVKLADDVPSQPIYRIHPAITCGYNLADLRWNGGRPREAVAALRQSVSMFQKLVAQVPGAGQEWRLRECRFKLAVWLAGVGEDKESHEILAAYYLEGIRLKKDNPETHFGLGATFAQYGCWREAGPAYDRGLELDPSDHARWCQAALVHLRAGDSEGYRRTCREVLRRFGDTEQPVIAERAAKVCLLFPNAVSAADFDRVQHLATRAVTGTEKDGFYYYFARTKGLAEYRAGNPTEAMKWLRRLPAKADGNSSDAETFALLAMVNHRLSRDEEAKAALAKAEVIVAKMPVPAQGRGPLGDWFGWVVTQVLYREADELMKNESRVKNPESGKKPD